MHTNACLQFDDAHKLIVGHPELEGAGILVRHLGLQEQGVTPQQFLEVSRGHEVLPHRDAHLLCCAGAR